MFSAQSNIRNIRNLLSNAVWLLSQHLEEAYAATFNLSIHVEH